MPYLKKALGPEDRTKIAANVAQNRWRLADHISCDFCGDSRTKFVYASRRMTTGEAIACWRWAACELCSEAIDALKWGALKARVVVRLRKMLPDLSERACMTAVEHALLKFHADAIFVNEEE